MYVTNVEGSSKQFVEESKVVKRSDVKMNLTFEDYRKFTFDQYEQMRKIN